MTPFEHPALVRVSTKALVKRYNEALEALGLAPTKQTHFHVDTLGYSYEIAEEQGPFYLSHGPANPLGIIVSPNQQRAPLNAPVASFYEDVMLEYYRRFSRQIADTTKDAALWLDFDQGLSRYTSPQSLLLLEGVTVLSGAGGLSEAAAEQENLVRTFLEDQLAWFDPQFRQRIIASAKAHGDLRERALLISELRYSELGSFYTPAFGGAFVLHAPSANRYLVLCDETSFRELETKGNALYLHDPELVEQLYAENLVHVDLNAYRKNASDLKRIYDYLLADILFEAYPDIELSRLTAPQRRQRLRRLQEDLPDTLLELEVLTTKLEGGIELRASQLSGDLIRLLLRPPDELDPKTHRVVSRILARLEPRDVVRLYRADKERFLALYQTWPEGKRRWAAALVSSRT